MARWVEFSSSASSAPGPPGPPGPSGGTPAPNITSATLAVGYVQVGNGWRFTFSGVITLPTGSPDYSHLKRIDVTAIDPSGQSTLVVSFTSWIGTTITYDGVVGDQPPADQVWSCEFIVYNEDGSPTPSPYTLSSLNVFAAAVSSVVGSEVANSHYQDVNQGLHFVVQAVTTLAHGQTGTVTFWIDYDDGRGFIWNGSDDIVGPAQVTRFGDPISVQGQQQAGTIWVPPPSHNAWRIAAFPGYPGDSGVPLGAVISSFTVSAVAQCLPGDVTNAQFNPQPISGDPIVYTPTAIGHYLWDYYQLQFDQPTLAIDPNYWFTFLTIQKGYSVTGLCTISGGTTCTKTSGASPFTAAMVGEDIHVNGNLTTVASFVSSTVVTLTLAQPNGSGKTFNIFLQAPDPEGVDESQPHMLYRGRWVIDSGQYQGTVSIPGTFVYLNGPQLYGTIPIKTNSDGSTNLYITYRFRLYCASHINDNALGNSTGYVLQTSAWPANSDGSRDYTELTPLLQPPALDLTQAAGFSLGTALGGGSGVPVKVNLTGPVYADIANNVNIRIDNNFVVKTVGGVSSLSQNIIDLALAVNFDTTNFQKVGSTFIIKSIAVDSLIAGNALFAGTATFAYNGGGKLTLNSLGLTIADNNISPTATVVLASSGISINKGTNSISIIPAGIQLADGSGNTLTLQASNITIQRGISSVVISPSSVAINNGSFAVTSGTMTLQVNATNHLLIEDTFADTQTGADNLKVFAQQRSNPANVHAWLDVNTSSGYGQAVLFGLSHTLVIKPITTFSASAGSGTLPSAPVGFLTVEIDGTNRQIPYYA